LLSQLFFLDLTLIQEKDYLIALEPRLDLVYNISVIVTEIMDRESALIENYPEFNDVYDMNHLDEKTEIYFDDYVETTS